MLGIYFSHFINHVATQQNYQLIPLGLPNPTLRASGLQQKAKKAATLIS